MVVWSGAVIHFVAIRTWYLRFVQYCFFSTLRNVRMACCSNTFSVHCKIVVSGGAEITLWQL